MVPALTRTPSAACRHPRSAPGAPRGLRQAGTPAGPHSGTLRRHRRLAQRSAAWRTPPSTTRTRRRTSGAPAVAAASVREPVSPADPSPVQGVGGARRYPRHLLSGHDSPGSELRLRIARAPLHGSALGRSEVSALSRRRRRAVDSDGCSSPCAPLRGSVRDPARARAPPAAGHGRPPAASGRTRRQPPPEPQSGDGGRAYHGAPVSLPLPSMSSSPDRGSYRSGCAEYSQGLPPRSRPGAGNRVTPGGASGTRARAVDGRSRRTPRPRPHHRKHRAPWADPRHGRPSAVRPSLSRG